MWITVNNESGIPNKSSTVNIQNYRNNFGSVTTSQIQIANKNKSCRCFQ